LCKTISHYPEYQSAIMGFKTQDVENHAMITVMEYQDLVKFWEL
jgi:hypothetical protein